MYDPTVGRFLEDDPIGFAAGDPNLYRYVGNSPTNKTDPSGLMPPDDVGLWIEARRTHKEPAPAQPVVAPPANDHLTGLQQGESVPPNFRPGGPSDVPDKLDGTWQVSIVVGGGHAYIRYENTETGETHTVGNYEHGYGGRIDANGRVIIPPVTLPGLQWDQDMKKEAGFKGDLFQSRTVVIKDPVIYKDSTPFEYGWYGDNCTTYAKDAWHFYTGEVYFIVGPDVPGYLESAIKFKNEHQDIITPYFKSFEPF
jgi:hypothetical protein